MSGIEREADRLGVAWRLMCGCEVIAGDAVGVVRVTRREPGCGWSHLGNRVAAAGEAVARGADLAATSGAAPGVLRGLDARDAAIADALADLRRRQREDSAGHSGRINALELALRETQERLSRLEARRLWAEQRYVPTSDVPADGLSDRVREAAGGEQERRPDGCSCPGWVRDVGEHAVGCRYASPRGCGPAGGAA